MFLYCFKPRGFISSSLNDERVVVSCFCSSSSLAVFSSQIISRVCQLLQIPSLEAGGLKTWTATALKDLQYTMREINMFIEVSKQAFSSCFFLICMFGCS